MNYNGVVLLINIVLSYSVGNSYFEVKITNYGSIMTSVVKPDKTFGAFNIVLGQ